MKPFNLEEFKNNPSQKVVTRDGRSVQIHCTNYEDKYPIIAEIEGEGNSLSFGKDGNYFEKGDSLIDLFLTQKKEGFVNVYYHNNHYETGETVYNTEEDAKLCISPNGIYITTVRISWEE